MDTIQRGIALLLKSAITGQPERLPEGFTLSDAFELIKKHRIYLPIYEGAVRCGISRDDPLMVKLLGISYKLTLRSEQQQQTIDAIFAALEASGIAYMPVKGCNLKKLYPTAAMRSMGDVDILIHREDYPRIRPLLQQLGLTEGIENDHVYPWRAQELLVELHKSLVPPRHEDYYGYYGDGWHLAIPGDGCRHDLSIEDAYVFLFAHFARHYRSSGIGCRHLLDLYVYRRAYPNMDEGYLRRQLQELKLLQFHENMERTLAVWFGEGQEDAVTELITEYIFRSGDWGNMTAWTLHRQVQEAKRTGSVRHSRLKALTEACFPPLPTMRGLYPVLRKCPILLPVLWVVRLVNMVLFRREHIRKRAKHFRAVSDAEVTSSLQALEAVGLTYDNT